MKMIEKIHGICGPKCTECEAYQATRKGKDELEILANKWTISLGQEYSIAEIMCDGCRTEGKYLSKYCSSCEIRICAKSRNYETCANCPDSPCKLIVAPPAIEAIKQLKQTISLK